MVVLPCAGDDDVQLSFNLAPSLLFLSFWLFLLVLPLLFINRYKQLKWCISATKWYGVIVC